MEIPKGKSEALNRRTDNASKRTKTPIFKILKHEYHELHNKPCGLGVPEALAVSVIVSMILIVAEINS